MIDRALNFFTSLRLTVVLLCLSALLVFVGTLAQVRLGLYVAQEEYFRQFFVWWSPEGASWKIPVFPGGWLLGTLLLINLLAAHIKRFEISRKKIGIFLIHGGLILLLLGQFLTEVFQIESVMRLPEGGTRNYSEDARKNELAIIDVTSPDEDKVVSIPQSFLKPGEEIRHPELPFAIRVKQLFENSTPSGTRDGSTGEKMKAADGVGSRLQFAQLPPTGIMDDENKPAALVEVVGPDGALGEWVVSTWLSKYPWYDSLKLQMSSVLGELLEAPQSFTHEGRTYQVVLRPIRYYKPYSITLLKATHEKYRGTEIPKNFSSRILLKNPGAAEEREVLIYMNNPLRYAGETFFQFQMNAEPGMESSAFQVVKNPAWVTPYLACTLMGVGMLVQFLMHLVGFGRRRKKASGAKPTTGEPALARDTAERSAQ